MDFKSFPMSPWPNIEFDCDVDVAHITPITFCRKEKVIALHRHTYMFREGDEDRMEQKARVPGNSL